MADKPKVKNLEDLVSPEDLAKIEEASTSGAIPVDNIWMIYAEWLEIAGYQAYLDARDDARDEKGNLIISYEEILTIIEARRKLKAIEHYRNSEASFIGSASAQAKKPSSAFKKLTKNIIKQTKVQ